MRFRWWRRRFAGSVRNRDRATAGGTVETSCPDECLDGLLVEFDDLRANRAGRFNGIESGRVNCRILRSLRRPTRIRRNGDCTITDGAAEVRRSLELFEGSLVNDEGLRAMRADGFHG